MEKEICKLISYCPYMKDTSAPVIYKILNPFSNYTPIDGRTYEAEEMP